SSNVLRAALTARSTSALSPSATWQMTSPVAGLSVGKVLPETLSSHLPPIKSGWSLTLGGFMVRALVVVAVAMMASSLGKGRRFRLDAPMNSTPLQRSGPAVSAHAEAPRPRFGGEGGWGEGADFASTQPPHPNPPLPLEGARGDLLNPRRQHHGSQRTVE